MLTTMNSDLHYISDEKQPPDNLQFEFANRFNYSSIVEIPKFKTKALLTYFLCENGFILREIDIKSSEVTINK